MSLSTTAAGTATAAPHAPHAPEASRVRRLLGPFYVTGNFWYRFHGWGAKTLPSWFQGVVIWFFTTFFFVVLRKIRRAVAANLEPVLGPCGWWRREVRIYKTLHTFAWCLTERYERLGTSRVFSMRAEGLEGWRELVASGRGFIVASAHLGNWEVGSMLPVSRDGRRVHLVREAELDPRAQEYVSRLVRRLGGDLYVTHFAEDPQLGLVLLDALRQGEIVALQGDRPRTGGQVAEVTIFGRPFPLPAGTAALARAAGVPIVPVFVLREGRRRYRCEIRPPIEVAASGDKRGDLAAAQRRFAAELEAAITREPNQWFCFRRLWGPPAAESGPSPGARG